eukprot:382957_1
MEWIKYNEYDTESICYDIENESNESNFYNLIHLILNESNESNCLPDFKISNICELITLQYIYSKQNNVLAINFGISILTWLSQIGAPQFRDFKHEILNNKDSTIDAQLYDEYVVKCLIKIENNPKDHFTLDEMLSLKLYSDATKFQASFRKSFWSVSGLQIKRQYYWWGIILYKTILYHAQPIIRASINSKYPAALYHGLNNIFVIHEKIPYYHGPISTTTASSVAETFCDNKGLIWELKTSYDDRFRTVTGVEMDWISAYGNESEILLYNQYLPITATVKNFSNTDVAKANQLIAKLKIFKAVIVNPKNFYVELGFTFSKSLILPLKTHRALLDIAGHDKSKTILDRLVEELHITQLLPVLCAHHSIFVVDQKIKDVFGINVYKLQINKQYELKDENVFKTCTYKLRNINNNHEIKVKYNDQISPKPNVTYKIYVNSETLFGLNHDIEIQQINPPINKCTHFIRNLQIHEDSDNITFNVTNFNSIVKVPQHQQIHPVVLNVPPSASLSVDSYHQVILCAEYVVKENDISILYVDTIDELKDSEFVEHKNKYEDLRDYMHGVNIESPALGSRTSRVEIERLFDHFIASNDQRKVWLQDICRVAQHYGYNRHFAMRCHANLSRNSTYFRVSELWYTLMEHFEKIDDDVVKFITKLLWCPHLYRYPADKKNGKSYTHLPHIIHAQSEQLDLNGKQKTGNDAIVRDLCLSYGKLIFSKKTVVLAWWTGFEKFARFALQPDGSFSNYKECCLCLSDFIYRHGSNPSIEPKIARLINDYVFQYKACYGNPRCEVLMFVVLTFARQITENAFSLFMALLFDKFNQFKQNNEMCEIIVWSLMQIMPAINKVNNKDCVHISSIVENISNIIVYLFATETTGKQDATKHWAALLGYQLDKYKLCDYDDLNIDEVTNQKLLEQTRRILIRAKEKVKNWSNVDVNIWQNVDVLIGLKDSAWHVHTTRYLLRLINKYKCSDVRAFALPYQNSADFTIYIKPNEYCEFIPAIVFEQNKFREYQHKKEKKGKKRFTLREYQQKQYIYIYESCDDEYNDEEQESDHGSLVSESKDDDDDEEPYIKTDDDEDEDEDKDEDEDEYEDADGSGDSADSGGDINWKELTHKEALARDKFY